MVKAEDCTDSESFPTAGAWLNSAIGVGSSSFIPCSVPFVVKEVKAEDCTDIEGFLTARAGINSAIGVGSSSFTPCSTPFVVKEVPTLSGSRWKAKGYAKFAAKNPMSEILKQLQSSLTHSRATAMLSGFVALIKVNRELANLLEGTCFGHQITTSAKDEDWFQLSSEEIFYMHHALQSLNVVNHNGIPLSGSDLWNHLKNFKATFPELYISYAHLRRKNWVVRSGVQYGADFVAYRHHPSLVHSDYAVIVLQEGDDNMRQSRRLRAWPDLHCSTRVCGSVAKSLLVLFVNSNGSDATLHSCVGQFSVQERVITRWVAKQCREEYCLDYD